MKIKRNSRTVGKKHEGETYIFKNGAAKVPGCRWNGKPMLIKLSEWKEMVE